MLSNLQTLFSDSSDPFLLVQKGRIKFANDAAILCFGRKIVGKALADCFGSEGERMLELPKNETFHEPIYIGDAFLLVNATWMEDVLIIRCSLDESLPSQTAEILSAEDLMMRSPLSMILVSLSLLRQQFQRAGIQGRTNLALIKQSVYRMMRVSNDLSLLSALRTKRIEPTFVNSDFPALLSEFAEKAAAHLEMINVKLRFSTDRPHHTVKADEKLLERLFYLLIGVAVRHGGCTEVCVSVHTNGKMARIIFSDNGKRPLEETLFFHSETDTSGSPVIHSSVPLAAEIVALHSGKIILGDEKDGPSSIIVMFPNTSIDTETMFFSSKGKRFEGGIDTAMLEFADLLPSEKFEK